MKISLAMRQRRAAAYTLVEMLISSAIVALAGGSIFLALTTGLNLFAKNTSVNSAHEQLLKAINHMTVDAHSSVSIPQLVNSDLTTHADTGSAAGVSMQVYSMGPLAVASTIATSVVILQTGSTNRPAVGQRLVAPENYLIEEDIIASAPNGTDATRTNITMANPFWQDLAGTVLITDRIAYAVVPTPGTNPATGELRYYPSPSSGASSAMYGRGAAQPGGGGGFTFYYNTTDNHLYGWNGSAWGQRDVVLARAVSTATPFSFGTYPAPKNPTNNTLIIGTLALTDPTYNKRGYQALGLSINFQLPIRIQLANYR